MSGLASVLTFTLLGNDAGAAAAIERVGVAATATGDKSAVAAEKSAASWSKVRLGVVAAGVAFAVESVKMAANFDKSMEMLHTQAGASQQEVDSLKTKVLALAPATGQGPEKLAEALYHVESAGYHGSEAMGILTASAKEASISGADLDSTTYSLTSTMKTFGDTGVAGANKDMAMLNAIVGQGDMHFQDLNDAIQTGILATGQTFGVSLQSMGAALDYLTDRGEKANTASTRLSMGIVLMANPTAKATKYLTDMGIAGGDVATAQTAMQQALDKSGLTTSRLADDLRKPDGIYVALKDLTDRMKAGGLTADQTASVIARVFGGAKTGKAVMSLVANIDGIKQKFDGLTVGASKWGEDFAAQQATLSGKWHDFVAGLQAAAVNFGHFMMPVTSALLSGFSELGHGIVAVGKFIADDIPYVIAFAAAWAALNFQAIIGRISDLSLVFEGMRLKMLGAADALRTFGGGSLLAGFAGVGGIVVGVAALSRGLLDLASSAGNVKKDSAQMLQGISGMSIDQLNSKIGTLANQWHHVADAGSVASGVFSTLTGGLFGGKTLSQLLDEEDAFRKSIVTIQNYKLSLGNLSQFLGIPISRVESLANTFGIDLTHGTADAEQKFMDMYASLGNLPPAFLATQVATTEVTKATQAYNDAITQSINLAAGQQGALITFNNDLRNLGKSLAGSSRDLSNNTDAGFQNQQAILKVAGEYSTYIGDVQKSGVPLRTQQFLVAVSTQKFVDQMVQLGFTRQAALNYLRQIDVLPPVSSTQFRTPGLPTAMQNLGAFARQIQGLPSKTIDVLAHTSIDGWLGAVLGQGGQSGSPTLNGILPPRADGGIINGPGGPRSDGILGIDRTSGLPTAWVSAKEFVTNANATAKHRPLLEAINADRLADGGFVDTRVDASGLAGLGAALASFPSHVASSLGSAAASSMKVQIDKAASQMRAQMAAAEASGGGGGVGGGVTRWAPLVLQALGMLGLPASLLGRALSQMQLESGGDPGAVDNWDSNAAIGQNSRGLMQTIPSTFAAYAGPFASRGIYDPLANIYAGLNYAAHRYAGDPNIGLGYGHGYALGGVAPKGWARVGENGPELVNFGSSSRVLSNRESMAAAAGEPFTIVIKALDAQDVKSWLNRGGAAEIQEALDRRTGRGGVKYRTR